jgi:phage-related protein
MSVGTAQVVLLGGVFLVIVILLIGVVFYAGTFGNLFNGITAQLSTALQSVSATFTSVTQFLVSSLTSFSGYLVRTFRTFVYRVGNGFLSVSDFLESQIGAILSSVNRFVLQLAAQIARNIISGFFNLLNAAALLNTQLTEIATGIITKLSGLITQGIAILFNLLSSAFTSGLGFISEIITTLIGAVGAGVSAILTGIAAGIDIFADAINFTRLEIIDPALNTISNAYTTVQNELDALPGQFQTFLCKGLQCLACALCGFCRSLKVPAFVIPGPCIILPVIGIVCVPDIPVPAIPILGSACDPLCDSTVCSGFPVCPCPGCGGISC